jgi:hypothetical protein
MPKKFVCLLEILLHNLTANEQSVRIAKNSVGGRALLAVITILACLYAAPQLASAQQGEKTVYNSSSVPSPSKAWIDASAFWSSGPVPDLCAIINQILTASYSTGYPNGAVIDARGLYNPNPTGSIACSNSPFDGVSGLPPTTILLPSADIPITKTWTLPNNMKIVGVGGSSDISGINATPPSGNSTLTAASSFTGTDLIDMGSTSCPTSGCSGVAVEHLFLNGAGQGLNGIVNNWSQTQSYVNDVHMINISLTGLKILAPNSGPYSNVYFGAADVSTCNGGVGGTCPICVDIEAQTRGLHGITCVGTPAVNGSGTGSPEGDAAIYINASNNTVEDVHLEAFWDGIEIGDVNSGVVGNVVVADVVGGGDSNYGYLTNMVHICGPGPATQFGRCNYYQGTVSDVTILQTTDLSPAATTSIVDDTAGTWIGCVSNCPSPNSLAGTYALGEPIAGGFSRFSTSPISTAATMGSTTATWAAGNVGSTGIANEPCTVPGALYSNTGGGVGTSVYVCTYSGSSLLWVPIA